MITPGIDLLLATRVALALAVAGCVILLARLAVDFLADHRLRRAAATSRVLRDLLTGMEARPTLAVRRALARREFLADVEQVEAWLRGVAPDAALDDPELLARHRLGMRTRNSWAIRAASAGLLGWTRSPDAAPALLRAATGERDRQELRVTARRALDRIRDPRVITVLLDALVDLPTREASLAVEIIAGFGPDAIAALQRIRERSTGEAEVRRRVVHVLGEIGGSLALEPLLHALNDEDPEVRIEAARTLSGRADARVTERLLAIAIDDPSAVVRASVSRAVAAHDTDALLDHLHKTFDEGDRDSRLRVIEALEQCGPPARTLLAAILPSPDRELARRAALALDVSGAISHAIRKVRDGGYDALASELLIDVGKAGYLDPILRDLEDPDGPGLLAMVRILGRIGDIAAGSHLAPLMKRVPKDRVHARVVDALRRIGDGEHTALLLPFLESHDEWLRKSVVDYLAEFGSEDTRASILPLLEDPNPWIREAVLKVLEHLPGTGEVVGRVAAHLDDPYDFVGAAAIRTLCAMEAFEALLESGVLERVAEERIRESLLQGLRAHATVNAMPIITRLAAFCSDRDLDLLRHAAGRAVDGLDEPEVDLVLLSYGNPEEESSARWFATIGWCRASNRAAAEWRDELLRDADPKIRGSMMVALSEREQPRTDIVMALYEGLGDPAPMVVRGALFTAARLELHELLAAVLDARSHEDEDVRVDATLALGALPGNDRGRNHFEVEDMRRRQIIATTAARLHRGQVPAIVDWVRHLKNQPDRAVIDQWVERHRPMFQYLLFRARDRDDLPARVLLCQTPFAAEQLLLDELVTHPDPTCRLFALRACIALATRRCHGRILSAFFTDSSVHVRTLALLHLVRQNAYGRRREYIERGLRDHDTALAARASRLCALLPSTDALELLAEYLNSREGELAEATIQTLAKLVDEGGEEAIDQLVHAGHTIRFFARLALVLDRCTGESALARLEELSTYAASEVRIAAIPPLLRRGGEVAWGALERGLQDPAPEIRARTIQAVGARPFPGFDVTDPRVTTAVSRAHLDPNAEVRARTALALARIALPGRSRFLIVLQGDQDARVARIAHLTHEGLARLGTEPEPAPR